MIHGGVSLVKTRELRAILSNDHLSDVVPTLVICIGVFIFLISFIGCCGAMQYNICLLETYSIFLMVLVLFQVMLACFIFLFVEDIQQDSGRSFGRMWRSRISSPTSRMMIDMIQENLECCGSENAFDYLLDIPKSCCKRDIDKCTRDFAHNIGCRNHLQESIKTSAKVIAYMCLGTALFELTCAILGFVLSGYIRKVNAIRRCCY